MPNQLPLSNSLGIFSGQSLRRLLIAAFFCFSLLAFIPNLHGAEGDPSLLARINSNVGSVLFFDVSFGAFGVEESINETTSIRAVPVPFLVALLFFGATFFTLYLGFINVRGFWHALQIVAGRYDRVEDEGEISHFRALTSALSATVGLGNIAGVAVAIQVGGPGAVFWMVFAAFFGMSAKFSSCTLAQLYRGKASDATTLGGPMYYLDLGLREIGRPRLGKVLGVLFSVCVIAGCLGGGCMFQVNQTAEAFRDTFALGSQSNFFIGLVVTILVASVIFGGIKRIGFVTSRIVPGMCGIYVLAALYVVFANFSEVPSSLALIFHSAFSHDPLFGGIVGVAVAGIQRAAFSNEAGLGSAAIAHAAAKTDEPIREGLVAMLGPFIDTVIVCTMTALVVIITGAWNDPELTASGMKGVSLTSAAFGSVLPWFPYLLTVCVGLFAYSSMISWCYYGERGWIYLIDQIQDGGGIKTVAFFRVIFCAAIMVGALNSLSDVINFTDLMLLSLALPNILGSLFLVPKVKQELALYLENFG